VDREQANKIGFAIGEMILDALTDWQVNAPRSLQSKARVLGMSEMGGCREYIRASIAGEPKQVQTTIKFPAFIGTALGDIIESIIGQHDEAVTQEDAQVTLPITGITVRGHLDIRLPNRIIDLKTKDKLNDVRREGPSFKERAQISGYLIGKHQEGLVDDEATGHLVYLDRSGNQAETFVWTVTVPEAREILEQVEDRLLDVQHALATGSREGRDGRLMTDEPESWCYHVQCPFYQACWAGHQPTGVIEHPRELETLRRLLQAKADKKDAEAREAEARRQLEGVEGRAPDGTTVKWIITENPTGGYASRLDVRQPKS